MLNEKELKEFEELLNESMNKIYDFGGMGICANVQENKIIFYDDCGDILTYYRSLEEEYQIEKINIWLMKAYIKFVEEVAFRRGQEDIKNQLKKLSGILDIYN